MIILFLISLISLELTSKSITVIIRQEKKFNKMAPAKKSNLAKSEVERIRKEARDEAIRETEAKYKRKVQETFQCVICRR